MVAVRIPQWANVSVMSMSILYFIMDVISNMQEDSRYLFDRETPPYKYCLVSRNKSYVRNTRMSLLRDHLIWGGVLCRVKPLGNHGN